MLLFPELAIHGADMGLGEIYYIYIVPQAGAVRSRIVVAEDRQALSLADGRLRDERHEVVRHSARQLADKGGRVGSDRVEIAESYALDARIGTDRVTQDVLADLLGVAVRGGRALAWRFFRHRKIVRLTVDGGGRAEKHIAAALAVGDIDYVDEREEIVAIVFERIRDRLPYSLVGGEMDHGVYLVVVEEPLHGGEVAEVHLHERRALAEDAADPLVVGLVTVGHVIGHDDFVAGLGELHGHMAPDESGPAGDKNGFFHCQQVSFGTQIC